MFKCILVPSTGSAADVPVFHTALAVARLCAAHIRVLDVHPDLAEVIMRLAPAAGPGYEDMLGRARQQAADRRQKVEHAFRDFCKTENLTVTTTPTSVEGPSAELKAETGHEQSHLVEYGRASDLIVLGRIREDAALAQGLLETAIMETGRPVLIAPNEARPVSLKTVAIAWKDTVEATRAVAAALPLIERADRVRILTVQEGSQTAQRSAQRLAEALRYHNKSVTIHNLPHQPRSAAETLLDRVNAENAGLLVMGAYGHSRLRELVLGGFTRHVLNTDTTPVLMAH